MIKHSIRYWSWFALSSAAFATFGFILGLNWHAGRGFWGPLDSGHAAAWVQAVGSIVAVGIAIYIPTKLANAEHTQREATRFHRARLLAGKLLVPTMNLHYEAKRLAACLSPLPQGADVSAPIYWSHGKPHRLDDIESIKSEWGELAVLNAQLGEKFAMLSTVVDTYNRRFDTFQRVADHAFAPSLLERDRPTLVEMAESIATLALLTHDAARAQSLLALPDSFATPSWASGAQR